MYRLTQKSLFTLIIIFLTIQSANAQDDFLEKCWSDSQLQTILSKTSYLHLAPSLETLSKAERKAIPVLLEVGKIFHDLYLDSRHSQALAVKEKLQILDKQGVDSIHTKNLLTLFRMMKGPIATTLENTRVPFLPVTQEQPGKNVYPMGTTRELFSKFLEENPTRRAEILQLRSIVRVASKQNVKRDLEILDTHPTLDVLHPGLRQRLEAVQDDPQRWKYYALPYSVAYAESILKAYALLHKAANILESGDPAFARYLKLRAHDLLIDNYDGGDATWVTGQFTGNLNAQIGSYETYDDALFGVKSFFSFSLLIRDAERSKELATSTQYLQEIENALPYDATKNVRTNIPVSVYNILADFGQSRGTNTATILPNESHLSRQFGRTILIRSNIITNPQIFEATQSSFNSAIAEKHHSDYKPTGNLYRTLWHEIGHYLGVDRTADGRELDESLQETSDLLEELKSDLVSLFAAPILHKRKMFDDEQLRAVYAGGIKRVLQKNKPRRSQAYQTMQLMQWNWFLDKGLLIFNPEDGRMEIDYDRYHGVVATMLHKVLALQYAGDRVAVNAFIDKWTSWNEDLHGIIANNIKAASRYRYSLVTYEALGDKPDK